MKFHAAIAGICLLTLHLSAALPAEYETTKTNAEQFYAERSYARANELYASVNATNLPPAEQRWVEFRRADTQWRSQAATQTADTTKLDDARNQLERQIRDLTRDEQHDRIWAEVEESLGDFFWTRRNQQNWGEAWPHYQKALDWWAGAADIELARERYLATVWKISQPPGNRTDIYYGYWGNQVPLEVLENAAKIAQSENDQAHAHFLIAMSIRNQGGTWEQRARVPEEFEGALKGGRATDWYDDALYNYGEWMLGQGRIIPLANGGWNQEADYVKALELFRRLVREFNKGETRYWDQAQQQIKNIIEPQLSVGVPNIYLPDSEIQYFLNWRNVKHVELALYPVTLNRDVQLKDGTQRSDWLQSINLGALEKIKSWSYNPHPASGHPLPSVGRGDGGEGDDHKPGSETLRLDGKLKPGAYVIEAEGGGKRARDLILVTDASLVLKSSGKQALVYFCNALDGSPLAEGQVSVWEQWWDDNRWHVRHQDGTTDTNGIAVFNLENNQHERNRELFVGALTGDRQAFATGNSYWYQRASEPWKIYAVTDRPAYRPKETVNWKFIARRYDGSVYSTPANQKIEFEIADPRGTKIKSDTITLNSFGSAWGSLELTEQMPLGEYRVQFWDEGRHNGIGNATLFRLEEYKLPEFKVTVQTPEEIGPSGAMHRKAFRLGERVEATIQADYYFGGPVANASVEVIVHQSPYWHDWHEPRPYPWLYDDLNGASPYGRWHRGYGGDQIVKRETIKTDATGKATITFDTPANNGQDLEYRIEARVTDASRREIVGNGSVRVTKQRYYVNAQAEHNLYRPQDKVAIGFKALDANDLPVQTTGEVKVTRDFWFEIWLAPDGHEVKGNELKRLQGANKIWPPAPDRPDQKGWRLKFRGYEHNDILTRTLKTDTNGAANLTFTPDREGYYRVAWTSDDEIRATQYASFTNQITAETTVWVANNSTTDLGYRNDGVEIIVDKDTFRVGQSAPVMLVANTSDRYVLFSVEGEDLYHYELVHLNGTVKLVQLPVEEKYTPNIFLNATLVSDRQIYTDTKQVIVPPTKNFLTVEVKPDRAQYQPRDEGTLTVTTRNDEGKPVSAEVALSLVDESVFYIQSDYAGDPRQFYFGTKRSQLVQSQSTFQQKSYAKLIEVEKQLMDERDKERFRQSADEAGEKDARNRADSLFATDSLSVNAVESVGGMGGGGGRSRLGVLSRAMAAPKAGLPVLADMPAAGQMFEAKLAATKMPDQSSGGEEPPVVVRSDFRSTVFWQPDVITGESGTATVKVKYPDLTTSWKATARAASSGNQFGIAEANTQTRQPLIVRLQAPRFFIVGDSVTISAVVNNNTATEMSVRPNLELGGVLSGSQLEPAAALTVPANGEARADWTLVVPKAGEATLKVSGRSGKYSDAMEKSFTVYEHGIEKFISKSGKARGGDITVKLELPPDRKAGSSTLAVQVTPSMAVTMLDALPYLIDYPYGCTEQTMSRFLPAVITAKTLRDLGLKPEDVMGRVFGGIETNSAAATHPKGKKDLAELDAITKAGLERLYDFQHSDGGWGWWKEGESDHWMTAYVVWGLTLAQQAGVVVKGGTIQRGVAFLDKELVEEEENPDMQAFMLHALAAYANAQKETKLTKFQDKAFTNLWANREKLNAYTRSLLALSAHYFGKTSEAKTLIANLENGVKRDNRPDTSVLISGGGSNNPGVMGTAHWGEDGVYWRWSEGGVEATAFALRALLTIDPTNALIEPVSNWLIKNRRGAQWNNTRDTAIVVLAMNDYLRASGELKTDLEYELSVNGSSIAKKKITAADVFRAPSRFAIDPKLIREHNEIRIRRLSGSGPAYFAAEAKFFSTEEPITPAGNEIFVKREYFKLVGRPTLLKGYVYDKEPLPDGYSVKSGERVQTVLTIEAKNNYEYLLFEDLKPAGFEAVEIRSGESLYAKELKSGAVTRKFTAAPVASNGEYMVRSGETLTGISRANRISVRALKAANNLSTDRLRVGQKLIIPPTPVPPQNEDYTGRTRWVYQELRDRKVALFIDKLPEGVWEVRYDLRAEVPGTFHALPVLGQAMYVPEIRCNGAETRVTVDDSQP